MIIRSVIRCPATRRAHVCRQFRPSTIRRFSSTSTIAPSTSSGAAPASMLGAFTNELDRIAPKFEIRGSQIRILREPSEFYDVLKAKILGAEKRIFLSTLYIGKTEHELISTLQQALRAKPELKLSILTDCLRGTRESPKPSCASLLAPLVQEFGPERVELRMYHTPNLTGLRKKYIPKRINEGWGLQHIKLYGMDDEVIISGANLSNDYFTNRQDRYHVFSSTEITDYFSKIHYAVANLSFLVTPAPQEEAGYTLEWPSSNLAPSPLVSPKEYITQAARIMAPLIKAPVKSASAIENVETNTTVYPVSQFTPLFPASKDESTELPALTSILKTLSSTNAQPSSWTFTAGYFNPSPALMTLLLSTPSSSSSPNTVITASPYANGFFGSKGVSGLLPPAYTLLARRFLERVERQGKGGEVVLKEWRRGEGVLGKGVGEGWSYHAKGLWISLWPLVPISPSNSTISPAPAPSPISSSGASGVDISVVGSSNYTKRSYSLDLETGVIIVTKDEGLKKRLAEEKDYLGGEWAKEVGMDEFIKVERRVNIKVRVAMWIVGLVGGAL